VSNVAEGSNNGGGAGSNGYAFIVSPNGTGYSITNYGSTPRIYGTYLNNTAPT
jgi:hypothetical protein